MIKNLKTKIMLCLFLLVGTMTLLTSCHKDDDVNPTPDVTKPATYTIMLYGSGSDNMDKALNSNLSQIEARGKTDRVNFAGLVKFSKDCQNEATKEGTRLFTLTNEGMKNEKAHAASYRMDNPAHLAQFIKDTKEKMPADKYILIFMGSSQEFGLDDKLPSDADYTEQTGSRSILFDDNVGDESLSVYEIEKGIKDSDTKMDLIYMDMPIFGMAEVNYQLKDCAKYLMASSSHRTFGGDYSELMENLQATQTLEEAIKVYVPDCMKYWKKLILNEVPDGMQAYMQTDLECYDLSYMDEFAGYLKDAVGEFKNIAQEASQRQKELDALYDGVVSDDFYGEFMGHTDDPQFHVFGGNFTSVDACAAFDRIGGFYRNDALEHYATQMRSTLNKMLVAHAFYNLPVSMDEISMGLLWPTNEFVDYLGDKDFKLAYNLKNAALYKATGWGDLLLNLNNPMTYRITPPQGVDIYITGKYSNRSYYTWQYDIEFDLSNVSQENVSKLEAFRKEFLEWRNDNAEKHPVPLCLGKFVFDEMREILVFDKEDLSAYGVHKLKLKVYVDEEINPAEPDQDKFPAEIVKEIEL